MHEIAFLECSLSCVLLPYLVSSDNYFSLQNNTWQGLVITDGATSYAVFTYRCGDMNWAYGPTIGFNAAGDYYVNHPNTGSTSGEEIACLNSPTSQWYNLVYEISLPNATNLTAELPTVEPRKTAINFYSNSRSRYEVMIIYHHLQLKVGT